MKFTTIEWFCSQSHSHANKQLRQNRSVLLRMHAGDVNTHIGELIAAPGAHMPAVFFSSLHRNAKCFQCEQYYCQRSTFDD